MTDERIMMLEKVGFVWNATPEDWGARYEELKRYHQKHGHCLVPQQYAASPYVAIVVHFKEGRDICMNHSLFLFFLEKAFLTPHFFFLLSQ